MRFHYKLTEKLICFTWFASFLFGLCCANISINAQRPFFDPAVVEDLRETEQENIRNRMENQYAARRLDLNKCNRRELHSLQILDHKQLNALLHYRDSLGPFISLYELQAVPGLDVITIKDLIPFVKISRRGLISLNTSPVNDTKHTYYARYKMKTNNQSHNSMTTPYALWMRYTYDNESNLRLGLSTENDAGEPFLSDGEFHGPDHITGYVEIEEPFRWVKKVILGDYGIHLGQGLTYSMAFQMGKSSRLTRLNALGQYTRPNRSIDENHFHRGVCILTSPVRNTELLVFYSRLKLDATTYSDSIQGKYFQSINRTGYHRDSLEKSRKDQVLHAANGISLAWKPHNHLFRFNMIYQAFDIRRQPPDKPVNLFAFSGKHLFNTSLDYQLQLGILQSFGEVAFDREGHIGTLHGLLIPLDAKFDLGVHMRYYSKTYQSFRAQPLSESNKAHNEYGWYSGLTYRPAQGWTLSAYIDYWIQPWISYQTDRASAGTDFQVRLAYKQRHKWSFYLQGTGTIDRKNAESDRRYRSEKIAKLRLKYFQSFEITKDWEWRTRLHVNIFKSGGILHSSGWFVSQDLLFRPMQFPVGFSGRIAWFHTTDYDSRIYVYENNVLNTFSIPAHSGKGFRYYLNIRSKIGRNITLEGRMAVTHTPSRQYLDQTTLPQQVTREFTCQFRWKF